MNRNFTSVTKMYDMDKINHTGYIAVENSKTIYVPLDEANKDYQAIQEWAKIEGNNIIDPGA